jgi:lipopolysaccharide transport protein LptA
MKLKFSKLALSLVTIVFVANVTCSFAKPAAKNTPKAAETKKVTQGLGGIANDDALKKAPTIINSKSLEVDSNNRIFYYKQAVVVKQADLTLLCDELEGHYDQNNQIEKLIAKKNVLITKGATIKASSQRAVYEAKSQIITLTQNPQLEQNGSLLSADVVKVFVAEDRSVAEGDVQVTLINSPAPAQTTPSVISTPASSESQQIPGVSILGGPN